MCHLIGDFTHLWSCVIRVMDSKSDSEQASEATWRQMEVVFDFLDAFSETKNFLDVLFRNEQFLDVFFRKERLFGIVSNISKMLKRFSSHPKIQFAISLKAAATLLGPNLVYDYDTRQYGSFTVLSHLPVQACYG